MESDFVSVQAWRPLARIESFVSGCGEARWGCARSVLPSALAPWPRTGISAVLANLHYDAQDNATLAKQLHDCVFRTDQLPATLNQQLTGCKFQSHRI